MMSLESIKANNREAAARAALLGKRPLLLNADDWESDLDLVARGYVPLAIKGIPALAPEYVAELYPAEYEPVGAPIFVDKGGPNLWDSGGPALSVGGFCEVGVDMTAEHGALFWTIHNEGAFQIYASAYKRVGGNGRPSESRAEPVPLG